MKFPASYCWVVVLVFLGCESSPTSEGEPPEEVSVRPQLVVAGLPALVHLTSPPGDDRLFVVEQAGRIRIVEGGQVLATPFLDIRDRVLSGGERGLLSVAFHPSYASNGFFYVNYTDRSGDTRIERYSVSSDRSRADVASASLILFIDQPFPNHNGGHILFGPDGMLYIGMGDGGSGGDPQGHGQNTDSLLGKILRIDVDGGSPYRIPANNPFVGRAGFRGEIWASGVRNPWRMAFDRTAGLLYIADVGQDDYEEVHISSASQGGLNYGWNRMEGAHCYPEGASCNRNGLEIPQFEYTHSDGCSITGGIVYRGRQITGLEGTYFYTDYCQGWVRSFRYQNGSVTDRHTWSFGTLGSISSFGEDASGELYIVNSEGDVYKLVPG